MQRTSLLLACSSAVNGRDKKQMEEKITGYIDHIIFRNEDNGYTGLRANVPFHRRERLLRIVRPLRWETYRKEEARRGGRCRRRKHAPHSGQVQGMELRPDQTDRDIHNEGRARFPGPDPGKADRRGPPGVRRGGFHTGSHSLWCLLEDSQRDAAARRRHQGRCGRLHHHRHPRRETHDPARLEHGRADSRTGI